MLLRLLLFFSLLVLLPSSPAEATSPADARTPAAESATPTLADEEDDASESEDDGKRKRTVLGDLTSPWFHIGGGPGAFADTTAATLGGRFTLGGGFYTFGFSAGGGLEVQGNALEPISVHGVGLLGVAIPIPVFHPILAAKVGGGVGLHHSGVFAPELTLGGSLGFIVRAFDGKPGFRLSVEPAYVLSAGYGAGSEVYVTFALVL
ncbi:MAG: hypothetical protein KDA24_28715 [Deltaproteobacteria bacterium]|nr:hypothetical protein [Deltaproteobacteria bacterium]